MNTVYLICFVLGFVLSLLAAFGGFGRLHLGHLHFGHLHLGHTHVGHIAPVGHALAGPTQVGHADAQPSSGGLSALNGFTLPAFLCWFGGTGYLLNQYTPLYAPVVLLIAIVSGLAGASLLYLVLFKFMLSRERVLTADETRMDGVVGRISDAIRAGGTGEMLFSQADARRSAAARSESGLPIPRGTEVVVLRYVHGIAYVTPLEELIDQPNS